MAIVMYDQHFRQILAPVQQVRTFGWLAVVVVVVVERWSWP